MEDKYSNHIPIPPADLMRLSVASADPEKFLSRGYSSHKKVISALSDTHLNLDTPLRILEWGCGCGRIARHFNESNHVFYGVDINELAIKWCDANLKFGNFFTCDLNPPLPFESEYFDVIYAGSVITHLSLEAQIKWCAELHRILKPDGRLLLTFHGSYYIDRHHLRPGFRFSHVGAGLFAELGDSEGLNSYGVYQTREATRNIFFLFKELSHIQMHDILSGQDTIVFDKRYVVPNKNGSNQAIVLVKSGENGSGPVDLEVVDNGRVIGNHSVPRMLANQVLVLTISFKLTTSKSLLVSLKCGDCEILMDCFVIEMQQRLDG